MVAGHLAVEDVLHPDRLRIQLLDNPIIKIEDVTKIYKLGNIEVVALNNVSFTINRGEIISIMGPSGSGKSTLMNILGCLDITSAGNYYLEGLNVSAMKDSQLAEIRNKKVGFVFQTYNLLPRSTAWSNVELPLLYSNASNIKLKVSTALSQVGLTDRAHHKPTELSGGQQQRVGIARALVKNPSILLADEPTGNLDSESGNEIMKIIQNLNRETGLTVIIVTHETSIAKYTDRIISVLDGSIVSDIRQKAATVTT